MTSTGTAQRGAARAGAREWTGLGVLLLPLLIVSMDVSVLYFAVPFISRSLQPSSAEQLWIFDSYGFVLACSSRWAHSATASAGGGCC